MNARVLSKPEGFQSKLEGFRGKPEGLAPQSEGYPVFSRCGPRMLGTENSGP